MKFTAKDQTRQKISHYSYWYRITYISSKGDTRIFRTFYRWNGKWSFHMIMFNLIWFRWCFQTKFKSGIFKRYTQLPNFLQIVINILIFFYDDYIVYIQIYIYGSSRNPSFQRYYYLSPNAYATNSITCQLWGQFSHQK